MVRRGGTIVLNGLPPGSFPLPIIDMVLNGITLRGSDSLEPGSTCRRHSRSPVRGGKADLSN